MRASKNFAFSLLVAAAFFAPSARAQLMLLKMESSHVDADFYDYNVTHTDWEQTSYITHHRRPVAGTMLLQTSLDLQNPTASGTNNVTFWGNVEGVGEFAYEFGSFTFTPQTSGAIDLSVDTWEQGSPFLNLIFGLRINPHLSVTHIGKFEFRTYLEEGPGSFWGDSTLWATFDHASLTPVAFTPVPEPSAFGAIAAIGILGIVGRRHRLHPRAVVSS